MHIYSNNMLMCSSRNTLVYFYVELKIMFGIVLPRTIQTLFSSQGYFLTAKPEPKPNTPRFETFEYSIPFYAVSTISKKIKGLANSNVQLMKSLLYKYVWAGICIYYRAWFQSNHYFEKIPLLVAKTDEITEKIWKIKVLICETNVKIQDLNQQRVQMNGKRSNTFAKLLNTWTVQNIEIDLMQKSLMAHTEEEYYEMFRIKNEYEIEYEKLLSLHQMIKDLCKDFDDFVKTQCTR